MKCSWEYNTDRKTITLHKRTGDRGSIPQLIMTVIADMYHMISNESVEFVRIVQPENFTTHLELDVHDVTANSEGQYYCMLAINGAIYPSNHKLLQVGRKL